MKTSTQKANITIGKQHLGWQKIGMLMIPLSMASYRYTVILDRHHDLYQSILLLDCEEKMIGQFWKYHPVIHCVRMQLLKNLLQNQCWKTWNSATPRPKASPKYLSLSTFHSNNKNNFVSQFFLSNPQGLQKCVREMNPY